METIKKIGAFFALFIVLIGAVTSLVLTAQQSLWVAFAGQLFVIAAAVPTLVKVFKFLTDRQQDFPLKVGDEFTTDQGEHLRVIGFEPDGTPKCEYVKE